MIVFYDNRPLEPDNEGFVDVERIYCFDWDSFDKPLFDLLMARCAELPEPKSRTSGLAWYSEEEDIEYGYLHASVEIPGLQVYGTLKLNAWQEWDRTFQSLVDGLPMRDLKSPNG